MIITDNNAHIDKARFYNALKEHNSCSKCDRAGTIGTLYEKSLHSVLKWYYEPDGSRHETGVGTHVADIVGEDGIIEIQTRNLSALRPKLRELLDVCRVTVVHPIIVSRLVTSIDGTTGEIISIRRSPRHASLYTQIRELYSLRDMLGHENLTVKLPFLTADEYRTFGVATRRRKKQRSRRGEYVSDIIPTDLIDEITLAQPSDYSVLLPAGLPERFTSADFAAAARTDDSKARMAINLLLGMGLISPDGMEGRRRKYRTSADEYGKLDI